MAGKAIGKTFDSGYVGSISRAADALIVSYPAKSDIEFGAPVILNDDNTVSAVKQGSTAPVIGFALRTVSQPKEDNPNGWRYAQGDVVEVLTRGTMMACVQGNADIEPRQAVFIDPATGGLIADQSGVQSPVAIPGAYFTGGRVDMDGVTEVVLTQRLI